MADNKIKVNELQTATPELSDTLLASGAEREYACRISDLKDAIGGGGGGLNNAKDAENGGIIEGLVNGNEGEVNIASGQYAHAEGGSFFTDDNNNVIYSPNTASGYASHAEGSDTTASGSYSHAEGQSSSALNWCSHAEGNATNASGYDSHAEGSQTTASSDHSHAEGLSTTASGNTSHAEGSSTTASGQSSHAEGYSTTASGSMSHAEGGSTIASGVYSHVEGEYTTANHFAQHVFGRYNIADPSTAAASSPGTYVEIVGNGNRDNNRSNARTLDWSGNEVLAGSVNPKGGLILQSPDGSSYTLTMNNDGTLNITKNV